MKYSLAVLTAVSMIAINASAAETEISIYNQDLALIKKSQVLDLNRGVNEVVFDEVAEKFKPESAFVYGKGIRVLEQNYDYAGINYVTMLNANVGKMVNTVRQNPSTGANIYEKALLVAVDGATPVLKFDYGIETAFNGRVIFDEIPKELNSTPVLMAKVEAAQQGETDLELAYLTGGFQWKANYVAKVEDENTLSLLGRAAITNNSGSGYENISVNLIAGDVNTVQEYVARPMFKAVQMTNSYEAMDSFAGAPMIEAPVSLDSYYVYKIPEKTSLKNGQMKMVSFLGAPKVEYVKENIVSSSLYFSTTRASYKDVHPAVKYSFENVKETGLGMPLPQGKLSFYANDDNGALQFIGEDNINNTAEGQKVTVTLGKSFDIYAKGEIQKVTEVNRNSFKKNPNQDCPTVATTYQYDVSYNVTNKGKHDAKVVLKQPLNGKARIVDESLKGQNGEGNTYEWKFELKSGEAQDITVKVENTLETRECN